MRQTVQSLNNGLLDLADSPAPQASAGARLVRSAVSLISAGTERMLIDFGKANWIAKARQQPDKVRQVLEKARTDGILPTLEAVRAKLDTPIPLGYCNAGVDVETGQRVASNGPHAEVVQVPQNLCAPIPDNVPDDSAAFTVVGAIALQGIRIAQPTLGESFVVTGLGLIGLLTVQLLRAQGCRVLGIDFDSRKIALAQGFGAETADLSRGEDPVSAAEHFAHGRGIDGVIITAATKSNEPVHQAAQMCRQRGRIVLIGVTGLQLSRDDFYKKELSFQVSCSYGPGRYDPEYEDRGHDYPYGFVRWTAQRNFEAVLDMMAQGKLDVTPLITHRFPFANAVDAYQVLEGGEPYLGILLEYPEKPREELLARTIKLQAAAAKSAPPPAAPSIGVIGAGGYATKVLLPAIRETGAVLKSIASSGGLSAAHAGRKFGFEEATTDVDALLARDDINVAVIATRHNSHARLVCRALRAGKNVFVEKPLALTSEELAEIETAHAASPGILMVGFNRRFAPHIVRMKELLAGVKQPKSVICTINAGSIPAGHWTQDPQIGGGRIIGEGCHFIDLMRFLTGSPVETVHTARLSPDSATISLTYQDGSTGALHYLANGAKSFPKERIEVFCAGRILALDNFRRLKVHGCPGFRKMNLWRQDKGNAACVAAFIKAVREGAPSPIPFAELQEVSETTIEAS